jgi:glycosyltransferase involved in cell wall biosynthesis
MHSKFKSDDTRLRVLFFDHVASLSGAEVALFNLIRHMDFSTICPIVVLGEEGLLADRLRSVVEVHILPMRAAVRQARKDSLGATSLLSFSAVRGAIRFILQLSRFIRTNNIDLVQTNSLKSDILGACAARLAGTPVVWYVRDRITPDYLPPNVARAFRWLSIWLPHFIITDSHAVARTLPEKSSRRIRVVHEGTPYEEFSTHRSTASTEHSRSGPVVGLVGRISPWKGQDIFIRAAGLLSGKYPQAQFRIIGAALFEEAAFEKSLHVLVEELGLQHAFTFTGFRSDIHQAISELDVLVHASTRPEPFGQVIIEGMAAGKPVVATNAGGVPEIVEDGVTGLLVPMGDEISMAAGIDRLLTNPQAARQMGLRGQRHVAENFGIDKTVNGVMLAYEQVTQRSLQRAVTPQLS